MGDVNIKLSSLGSLRENTSELDTHAETCVFGRHAFIVERHDQVVNVSGYDPTKGYVNNIGVVNATVTIDNVDTGESHVVIINQSVHVPTMEDNLLCPMQLRMHGTVMNDKPKFLLRDLTDDDHCFILQNETLDDLLRIPLTIKGVSSVFPSRKTTQMEYEKSDHFIATSNAPVWDPRDNMFGSQE